MYNLKSNLGRCQTIWQVANAVGRVPWYQPLSSSSVKADSVKEEETFGTLSSNPSSEFYQKEKHKRYDDRTPKDLLRNDVQPVESDDQKTSTSTASEVRKSYEQDQALRTWQKFKNVDDEKLLELSRNLVQDDDEGEYLRYFSGEFDIGKKLAVERNRSDIKNEKPDKTSSYSSTSRTAQTADDDEPFGTLSPPKDLYELEEGDEGDKKQMRFEEALLERRHRPAYYGYKMKSLCKERKLQDALKILEEEMPAVAVKPDKFCYQILINACGRAGYTKKAFQLYNQMKKRGLEVQPVAYTGLFNACAHSPWPTKDGLHRAHKLYNQLKEKGYIVNQTTSHAMIKAFGRCGDIKMAFQIVDEMLDQGLLVTTETINFMLQSCISDQEIGFRYALLVWRKMRELRLLPDIYSYNLLVRCVSACKAGDPSLTTQLLEGGFKPDKRKSESNPEPPERTKGNIKDNSFVVEDLDVKSKEHDTKEPLTSKYDKHSEKSQNDSELVEVLEPNSSLKLRRKVSSSDASLEVLPNLLGRRVTIGCAVGLSSLAKPEDRLALLGGPAGLIKQMTLDKVKPDLRTVTQMIDSLPADSEAEASLIQSMKNVGLTPDTQFCNMLIRKRCFRHDATSAKEVLDLMQEHHLVPDIITFGCLALGCKTLPSATELLYDMDAVGFRPNLEIMTILIKNGITRHDYFYTLEMLREMHNKNVSPDENLLLCLETARKNAREFMIKIDSSQVEVTKEDRRKMAAIRLFLLEYKSWLKKSDMQQPDHPWAQYQFAKVNA